jgi:hypothetical protein
LFPAANTGIAWLKDLPEALAAHSEFLQDCLRVDLFGIKEEGAVDGKLHAPLRPELPVLQPGKQYLLESVVRTLRLGHPFTQGTADSNEVWLEITITSGDRVIGRSGAIDEQGGDDDLGLHAALQRCTCGEQWQGQDNSGNYQLENSSFAFHRACRLSASARVVHLCGQARQILSQKKPGSADFSSVNPACRMT